MVIAIALTVGSLAVYGAMMAVFMGAMLRRRRSAPLALERAPSVSILKPLSGLDDDLEANLESFAAIDYPSFEVILGVASPTDPAHGAARRFAAKHPELRVRVVVTDPEAAHNPKVAQLVGLEQAATGDVYVISDSNVRVRPGYLYSLAGELRDPGVGLVTSLFAGNGERTLGAALENLQLCVSSVPGYVAWNAVTTRPLTVGKSMAMRRRDLARLGGFRPLGDVLAEDHVLGRRFLDEGFRVRTSLDTVENRNVGCSVMRTLERHTRWSKLRRALNPAAFAIEPLFTPVLVATAAAVLAPARATAGMLAATCLVQTIVALLAVRVLRGGWMDWRYAPLEVVRSYVTLLCWMRACVSRSIEWRGHAFTLSRGSIIVPLRPSPQRSEDRARAAA